MANITVTPQGQVYLCKTPLENDYKNQLTFASATSQYNYFNSKVFKSYDNYTYIKKDNVIMVGENIDVIINCNYLFYRNTGFTSKWYYCFITNMEYINENCTRVTIETDAFQTWQFQIDYKPCFVEREHVNDDTVGLHTVDEGLQLGEYICNNKQQWLNDNTDNSIFTNTAYDVVVGATEKSDGTLKGGAQTDGIYNALRYYCFKNDQTDSSHGIPALTSFIEAYDSAGKNDAIKCIFMIPRYLTSGASDRNDHLYAGSNLALSNYINYGSTSLTKTITLTNNTLQGYTPVNKKLLTYPYNYLICSNNNGVNVIYRLEDFTDGIPKFKISACMTPSGSVRLVPYEYKGATLNDNESIALGKFPICSWDTDVYTNWLTQNAVNIGLNIAGSVLSTATGVATQNPIGIASGVLSIGQTLGEIYKESKVPEQANGNTNSGDVVCATGKTDFIFYNMSIKQEVALIIDNYFSMFGYKINRVKVPNITGRQNWNYIKTIDCNFDGDIPQTELQIIKSMFNNGVTLWHNPANIYNYNLTNNIVS